MGVPGEQGAMMVGWRRAWETQGRAGIGHRRSQEGLRGLGQGLGVLDSCSYNNQVYFVILKNKRLFYSKTLVLFKHGYFSWQIPPR